MRKGQQRVRLDRERERGSLHVPAAGHPPQLRGESGAARGRDVLDHAGGVCEIELAVFEREALGGVGLHERTAVVRTLADIHAGDVELGRKPPSPTGPQPTSTTRMPGATPVSEKKRSCRVARALAASGEARRVRQPCLAVAYTSGPDIGVILAGPFSGLHREVTGAQRSRRRGRWAAGLSK